MRRAALGESENTIFVSAASTWEISTKHRLGKLPGVNAIASNLADAIESQGFLGLPITIAHGQAADALPGPHRDPFDRMLIAQAMLDDLVLMSNERASTLTSFGVCGKSASGHQLGTIPGSIGAPEPST
jgi:PIN domain nuclease of toxin-antitoxin system